MWSSISTSLCYLYLSRLLTAVYANPVLQAPLTGSLLSSANNISAEVFDDLEELARIVDISYCVGFTGIQKPFLCASRCTDFEWFELVTVTIPNRPTTQRNSILILNGLDMGVWPSTF